MKNTYLFILDSEPILDLSKYHEFTDIHIWNYANIINYSSEQNIYIYAKNLNELDLIEQNGYIPHLCFIGDDIFSYFYENTLYLENVERFWFPNSHNIFNEHIQKNIQYADFLTFVTDINKSFSNPLFEKDLSLQIDEIFSEENKAVINDETYYVVLGLLGDYFMKNKPSDFDLMAGIMKDKICVKCEYAEICKNRGLGIIKHNNKIQSCIGIKLFNQN